MPDSFDFFGFLFTPEHKLLRVNLNSDCKGSIHSQYLVCKSSRHNDDIGLSGRGTEHNSISADEIFTNWHIYPMTDSKREWYQPVLTCPCRILGRQCASSPRRNRPIQKSEATESLFWRGKNIRESTKSRNQKVSWVSKIARPAPVYQIVNPGESPLNLVLLEVHLGKSYWSSVPGRNRVHKQVKSGGDLPWTESSHGSQLCRECLTPGSDSLESPEWLFFRRNKEAINPL